MGERAGTEAEAANAMAHVQRLLAQHNLSLDDVQSFNKPEDLEMDESVPSQLRNTYWQDSLYGAVAELYFCRVFMRTRIIDGEKRRWYAITGRPSNIEVVKYITTYLLRTCEELAKEQGKEAAQKLAVDGVELNLLRWRNSFKIGFTSRIWGRVKEQLQAAKNNEIKSDTGQALIIHPLYEREKKEIAAFFAQKNVKLKSNNARVNIHSSTGYSAGKSAASGVNMAANGVKGGQARIA